MPKSKTPDPKNFISVRGAREHNLKNLDIDIPRDKLVVITGLSGSGKSSLAFDTIYAEGQRRYVESLSTYARQFLELGSKPDVDQIDGLSPAISIDQKTTSRNPRSTVGTVTEIYDYLRLLFAKVGHPHCPKCGDKISAQTISQMIEIIEQKFDNKKIMILAPVIQAKKGEHQLVLDKIKKAGFVRLRVDGQIITINENITLDPKKKHTIEIVVDRLHLKQSNSDRTRLAESVELAAKHGSGLVLIFDTEAKKEELFSEHHACQKCGISLPEISPRSFSFNSPAGACPDCHGLGTRLEIDPNLLIPNPRLTIAEGAIRPWAQGATTWHVHTLRSIGKKLGFSVDVPWSEISDKHQQIIFHGLGKEKTQIKIDTDRFSGNFIINFEGVIPNLLRRHRETDSDHMRRKIETFMRTLPCPTCKGKRLKPEMLAVKVGNKNIIDLTDFSIISALDFFATIKLSTQETAIAKMILKEVQTRLGFLADVGLGYLTLSRSAATLSGGEAQRIRLATQIGSQLRGVLYVLDEPSIGLHQRDNAKLITTLNHLRDIGNSVIVVEHDEETMRAADWVIDIGPGAGRDGGELIAEGTLENMCKNNPKSLTCQYLTGKKSIPIPKTRRPGNGKSLEIKGARAHNLKNIDATLPLGLFIGITGVSGSGKSSLINHILVKSLAAKYHRAQTFPGDHDDILGTSHLDKIIAIDQSPIGRTPRSNPATYTGVFNDIRDLFSGLPEAKMRGYQPGRFSFNVKGGRCEACQGDGVKKIEMHFLPDVYVTCEACEGSRYNRETLEIRYHGKNIADILDMTVNQAVEFFVNIPSIKNKLETLQSVGLGYIKLGQSATTLSGGEAQRVKLSTELARRATSKTLYVLDEPTTGLHFEDVKKLLEVLQRLVDAGNTVLVIEHNLDVIKSCDWILDLGPEGGDAGGELIASGTPEQVAKIKKSHTGHYLAKILK